MLRTSVTTRIWIQPSLDSILYVFPHRDPQFLPLLWHCRTQLPCKKWLDYWAAPHMVDMGTTETNVKPSEGLCQPSTNPSSPRGERCCNIVTCQLMSSEKMKTMVKMKSHMSAFSRYNHSTATFSHQNTFHLKTYFEFFSVMALWDAPRWNRWCRCSRAGTLTSLTLFLQQAFQVLDLLLGAVLGIDKNWWQNYENTSALDTVNIRGIWRKDEIETSFNLDQIVHRFYLKSRTMERE